MFKFFLICLTISMPLLQGCRTLAPLPPVDLNEPGWTIYRGDALWSASGDRPELAGELIAAIHPEGQGLAQFTKNPFPLVTVRTSPEGWEIETAEGKRYSGAGKPPGKVIWFQLLRAISGKSVDRGWVWADQDGTRWRLSRAGGEESVEIYLAE